MSLQQKLKNLVSNEKLCVSKKHNLLSDIYKGVDNNILNIAVDSYNLYLEESGSSLDNEDKASFDEFLSVITAIKNDEK